MPLFSPFCFRQNTTPGLIISFSLPLKRSTSSKPACSPEGEGTTANRPKGASVKRLRFFLMKFRRSILKSSRVKSVRETVSSISSRSRTSSFNFLSCRLRYFRSSVMSSSICSVFNTLSSPVAVTSTRAMRASTRSLRLI